MEKLNLPRNNQDTKIMVSTNLTDEKLIEGRRAAKRARKPITAVEGIQSPKLHEVEQEK